MIRSKRILIGSSVATGFLLLVAVVIFLVPTRIDPLEQEPPSEEPGRPSQLATLPVPTMAQSDTDTESPTDTFDYNITAPEADIEASPEVLATRRMIAAHAPLREPSVADPDSPENMAVLQNMLTQLLAQPSHLVESGDE